MAYIQWSGSIPFYLLKWWLTATGLGFFFFLSTSHEILAVYKYCFLVGIEEIERQLPCMSKAIKLGIC